jgi:hypothetical protein
MTTIIKTKFGNARLCYDGYYKITTRKEGNHNKQLHRVIYEDYYKCTILPNGVIHHKDENRENNDIENLVLMDKIEHLRLHKKGNNYGRVGENHPFYNKHHSDEDMERMSKMKSNTGYFRVSKNKKHDVNQGFVWKYQYYVDGKRKSIVSVNLKDLRDKVVSKGLDWIVLDEDKARANGLA